MLLHLDPWCLQPRGEVLSLLSCNPPLEQRPLKTSLRPFLPKTSVAIATERGMQCPPSLWFFAFLLMTFSFSHIVLEMTSVSCDLISFFELAFCGEGGQVGGSLLKRPPGRAGKEGLHPCPNTADKTPRTVFSTPAFLFRVDCALLLLLLPKLVFVFMIQPDGVQR